MKFTTRLVLKSQSERLFENRPYAANSRSRTGLSPSMMSDSGWTINLGRMLVLNLEITTRQPKAINLHIELYPLHSPLLRVSLLVSFPRLINMLKFGRFPRFIWDRILKRLSSEEEFPDLQKALYNQHYNPEIWRSWTPLGELSASHFHDGEHA